ncbi:ribonuclease III family protein, partial [Methanosarcina sp. 2.H.T.1A.15]|uniref:ribonuclease III family protein n=1 Tax=Methanosarcina sp. 2.H.T.1A.15 TaxID=1483596 RepID=UPI00064ED1EF
MNIYSDFSDDLEGFQNIIGIEFENISLLIEALTHESLFCGLPSNMNIFKQKYSLRNANYQKLEFLGDAVLDLIIADHFYLNEDIEEYAKANGIKKIEGILTNVKTVLVKNESLVPVACKLNLKEHIIHGDLRNIEDVYADVIEALIGAIYRDQGFSKSKEFVNKFFDIKSALEKISDLDPKGKIQELYGENNIHYSLLEETGPDHCKQYTVGLEINGEIVSTGEGTRVKKAEAEAAQKYLYLRDKADKAINEASYPAFLAISGDNPQYAKIKPASSILLSQEKTVSPTTSIDTEELIFRKPNRSQVESMKVSNNTGELLVAWVKHKACLLYTSPSPRDKRQSRMP